MTSQLLKFWKLGVSPYLGNRCRFHPTCSEYSAESVKVHGFLRGSLLAVYRLLRCNPLCKGGIDEVPGPETETRKPETLA